MARYEFPSSSPSPPTTNEPAAGPRPPGRTTRTDARPDTRLGPGDGPVGRGPTTRRAAPEGVVRLATRYAQPGPRGTAPRVGQGCNNIHADAHAGAAFTHAPAATQQPAFRRYPVAASILVDEPWTVVNALVTVKKRRSIVDDILRANGLHHDRDDLDDDDRDDDDDDEPLRGSRAPRNNHPWKGGSMDAGCVSTS